MIPKAIKNILIKMEENGFEAYLVGGFVRDALLNIPTNDFDIATNALPKDLTLIFGPIKQIEYGSVHLKIGDYNVEITTYRKEFLYEKHKPIKIEYTTNLIEDSLRRDFTINALYMNKLGEVMDPNHFKKDLDQKILRMIGNPNKRLKEDPLRILRAIRFLSRYHLNIDKKLLHAIKKEKKNLSVLSKNRIKMELDYILLNNGFSYLKKFHLLDVLGIKTKNIIYVEDLPGLWAQIETSVEYPKEKNFLKREKNIKNLLKCGTIKMFDLYQYGYYDCRVAALVLNFPLKTLEEYDQRLPIHSRKDIALNGKEIESLSSLHQEDLGLLIKEIEEHIVNGLLKNEKDCIKEYIMKR